MQQKPTTTTSTPQPEAEKEEEANNVQKFNSENEPSRPEEEISSSTTSSTEVTRKSTFIRPFRSNEELLKRLKERRLLQQQRGYTVRILSSLY